jgi:2-keto-4-pentenoate hydratase
MDDLVNALAAKLIAAHRLREPVSLTAEEIPRSPTEAYAVQDTVARTLWTEVGDPIRGWKTGAPNAKATPIAAPIPQSKLFTSPSIFEAGDFNEIGIEAELAYTLGRDLPLRDSPYTTADVVAAVASIHVAIEVCDSRLHDWRNAEPLARLADNQINGALIIGSAMPEWRQLVPESVGAIVTIDGRRCAEAVGSHPFGNPIHLLPWLANHCAARCGGLRAGDTITTGAWTGMHLVTAPAQVMVRFSGIGEASAEFR